jgi:hypothetical protein
MVFDVHVQGFLFGSECSCRHLVNLGDAVCTLYVSSCLVELQQKLDITIAITTISLVRNDNPSVPTILLGHLTISPL